MDNVKVFVSSTGNLALPVKDAYALRERASNDRSARSVTVIIPIGRATRVYKYITKTQANKLAKKYKGI